MCGLRVGRIPPEFPGGSFSLCPDVSLGTAPCLSFLPCLSGLHLCWPSRCLGNPNGRRWDTHLGQQAVGAGRGQSQELLLRDRCQEDTSPLRPRGDRAVGSRARSADVIRHLRAAGSFLRQHDVSIEDFSLKVTTLYLLYNFFLEWRWSWRITVFSA